jgi:hypothetical protein
MAKLQKGDIVILNSGFKEGLDELGNIVNNSPFMTIENIKEVKIATYDYVDEVKCKWFNYKLNKYETDYFYTYMLTKIIL